MTPRQPLIGRAVLPDGAVIHIRPIAANDKQLLRAAFERLAPESRWRRFLHPVKRLSDHELAYFTEIDHRDHEALVAADHGADLVGVARYIRAANTDAAELAIVVADDWQGRGSAPCSCTSS